MSDLKYPQWQEPIQDAVLEIDPQALGDKILKAEAAIFLRLQELSRSSDHLVERHAIDDALSTLRTLKRENLRFPDWGAK